ncbi:LysR family transcriptional regulator [Jiella sp. MQZ9-1]|uniref:LysR family transcriptional regulator n=1 Tax=Jiella flava TaxID=2816857 RepID=A0A939FTS2_9HYPH|nr:LysR family transcriptional regulator [Jiella flava]MBO0661407.1 LysR family transcriptional regulator [Jiella flava]MCD2470051.1 LysR family transcriptional regulator [Jiella flava]
MPGTFDDLYFYEAVVRNRGFSAAGRELGVAKSVLSRRVRNLEERLGVRLIERNSSHFEVSEIGRDVFRHAQAAKLEMEEAARVAAQVAGEPRGLLRVSVPPGAPAEIVSNGLETFLGQHPKVRIQLIVTHRRLDLIEDRIDIAIRARSDFSGETDYVVKRLGAIRFGFVASPRLIAGRAAMSDLDDLRGLPMLGRDDMHSEEVLLLQGPHGEEQRFRIEPRVASNSINVVLDAARRGLGVGFLPKVITAAPIADGELVPLLPDWQGPESVFHIAFTSRRAMLPAVRLFVDFISERLKHLFTDH